MSSSSVTAEPTAAAASVLVKLSVDGELRKFQASSLADVRTFARSIVGNDSFAIKYTDDQGDDITCASEAEFSVAVKSLPAAGVLSCSVSSTVKDEKKAEKKVKKLNKKTTKKEKKLQKKLAASDSSESSDSSEGSEESSDSESDSSESEVKKDKKNKNKKKQNKKAKKHAKKEKLTKTEEASDSLESDSFNESDSTEESPASAVAEEQSRTLETIKAEVARLSDLHAKLKREKAQHKASKKQTKKAKKADKKSKQDKKAHKKSKKDVESSEDSSAEESSTPDSSSSLSEDVRKTRKSEIKKHGKDAVKAAREAVRQAKQDLESAKKKLQQEVHTFKADAKGKKDHDSRFVAHVTFPDPAEVDANASILKTFKFRNSGFTSWPATAKLLLVSRFDNSLNAPDSVEIGREVKSDEEIEITVPLKAPAKAGQYDAFFRLALANGKRFGQRVRSRIIVASASAPAAVPSAPAPAPSSPAITPTPADSGVTLLASAGTTTDDSVVA